MTIFRREPRSVYRVYAEDEYLDGEQPPLELDGPGPSSALETSRGHGGWSPGAMLVAGLIVAVAVAAVAIVFAAGNRASHRPVMTATTRALENDNRVELYGRRRPAPRRSRKRPVIHALAAPRPAQRWSPAPRPIVVVMPAAALPASDPQLEFGFER